MINGKGSFPFKGAGTSYPKARAQVAVQSQKPVLPYHIPPAACYIHNVPVEMLSNIFRECARAAPAFNGLLPSKLEAPLVLCWVCRSWRAVALADSTLWTRISNISGLCSNTKTGGISKIFGECIESSLERSARKGLALFLERQSEARKGCITSTAMLNLCTSALSRWQHLDIEIDLETSRILLSISPEDVPMLSSVAIHSNVSFHHTNDTPQRLLSWILALPRISHLLWGVPGAIDPDAVKWECLTHLKLRTSLEFVAAVELLTRCTHLVHLELGLVRAWPLPFDQLPMHYFPSLQVLTLGCTVEALPALLTLKTPNLMSLELVIEQCDSDLGAWSFDVITQFLTSCKQIKELRVYNYARGLVFPSVGGLAAIVSSWFSRGYRSLVFESQPHDHSQWNDFRERVLHHIDPEQLARFLDPSTKHYFISHICPRALGFGWGLDDPAEVHGAYRVMSHAETVFVRPRAGWWASRNHETGNLLKAEWEHLRRS